MSNKLIQPLLNSPFNNTPFHNNGPFNRYLLAGKGLHEEFGHHIALHKFSEVDTAERDYCKPHIHNTNELNIILSDEPFTIRVTLEDHEYLITEPTSILIPAGVSHSANIIEGTGYYFAILGEEQYDKTFDCQTDPEIVEPA